MTFLGLAEGTGGAGRGGAILSGRGTRDEGEDESKREALLRWREGRDGEYRKEGWKVGREAGGRRRGLHASRA